MKGNNFSKKFNGQIQAMGKGGIKEISNNNAIQPIPNYNQGNLNYGGQMNQMYPINQNQMLSNQMQMMPQQNQYNNQMMYNNNFNQMNNNMIGIKQGENNYENSKNKNNNINNNNNPIVRNAKMILDNNNMNMKNKEKAKSAKKVTDISKSNEVGYQAGQGNYNNMPMNNYNMGMNNMNNMGNMMYENNFGMINNPLQVFNNGMNMNNQYNPMNNMNNVNLRNNGNSRTPNMNKRVKKAQAQDYQYMEFHPYTLKDYKELTRNPVVMGPLGANIGTKEWEIKRNKMKKMQNYSNNINKEHKGIHSLKKDTPKDEMEKLTKQKIEKSIRHRTYEYGKLVRQGKYKEENENNMAKNLSDNLGVIPENDDDLYLKKYEEQLRQETENINNPKPKEPVVPVVETISTRMFFRGGGAERTLPTSSRKTF